MANSKLLKEAIADAKAVRETAIANAKIALEEAFTPKLQSILSKKLQSEMEEEEDEVEEVAEEVDSSGIGGGDNKEPEYDEAHTELDPETEKETAAPGEELDAVDKVDDLKEEEDKEEVEESTEEVSETEVKEEMEEEEVSKETKENISHDLPLVSRIEENVLDGEWITVSKQKKKMQKEKEEKTKIKKSTAKKNQQVSSPKEEEKIRYAKGPDNSTQGFERKVTVSPKPSKEKYRTPMRRYGYFTSPNLFFRGSSIFRETHDINNRRISSRTPQRPYPVSFNHNQSTLQHPQSRSLRTMMVSSYPRTSQWNLDLRPEHLLSRNLSELSFAQLDALEQIHADSIRRIQQARLELARANERQLVASQFQIARRGGV